MTQGYAAKGKTKKSTQRTKNLCKEGPRGNLTVFLLTATTHVRRDSCKADSCLRMTSPSHPQRDSRGVYVLGARKAPSPPSPDPAHGHQYANTCRAVLKQYCQCCRVSELPHATCQAATASASAYTRVRYKSKQGRSSGTRRATYIRFYRSSDGERPQVEVKQFPHNSPPLKSRRVVYKRQRWLHHCLEGGEGLKGRRQQNSRVQHKHCRYGHDEALWAHVAQVLLEAEVLGLRSPDALERFHQDVAVDEQAETEYGPHLHSHLTR